MDKLVRNGSKQTWIKAGTSVLTDRIVIGISGKNVSLDAPLPDSVRPELFDSGSDVPVLIRYSWPSRVSHSGVENLRAYTSGAENSNGFASFANAINCWARDINLQDYQSRGRNSSKYR